MAEKKLSKREQKAEAFKKRAKKPQFTDDMAVPESDEILPVVAEEPKKEVAAVEKPKVAEKRKAEPIGVPTEGSEGSEEPHKKKNRRSKKSSNMEGSRYIVFVGKEKIFIKCISLGSNIFIFNKVIYLMLLQRKNSRNILKTLKVSNLHVF